MRLSSQKRSPNTGGYFVIGVILELRSHIVVDFSHLLSSVSSRSWILTIKLITLSRCLVETSGSFCLMVDDLCSSVETFELYLPGPGM